MSAPSALDLQAALRRLDEMQEGGSRTRAHRRFQRFQVRGEARLIPSPVPTQSPPIGGLHVRDISRGGAGLLSGEPAPIGAFWTLELSDGGATVCSIPAFCRHCRHIINGAHLIGIEFGIDASILMSLGVPAKMLAQTDHPEERGAATDEFVDPTSLLA